ncbi:MAG: hypothetical protein AB7N71_02285 [Phycisphaerae bacterium]
MTGVLAYATAENDFVVPAYNMRGVSTGINNPLDGWAPILNRDRYVQGEAQRIAAPFCCPLTREIPGMRFTQTGDDPLNPVGYMDWPTALTVSQNFGITIPSNGFTQIIRVGYWINGDNPIGIPRRFVQGIYFTGSVGYGPDPEGNVMEASRYAMFRNPAQLIAFADGLYSGGQKATRYGERDIRIGYRHPGSPRAANVALADGHVESLEGDKFPRSASEYLSVDAAREENLGSSLTIYADPYLTLGIHTQKP